MQHATCQGWILERFAAAKYSPLTEINSNLFQSSEWEGKNKQRASHVSMFLYSMDLFHLICCAYIFSKLDPDDATKWNR